MHDCEWASLAEDNNHLVISRVYSEAAPLENRSQSAKGWTIEKRMRAFSCEGRETWFPIGQFLETNGETKATPVAASASTLFLHL